MPIRRLLGWIHCLGKAIPLPHLAPQMQTPAARAARSPTTPCGGGSEDRSRDNFSAFGQSAKVSQSARLREIENMGQCAVPVVIGERQLLC